MKKLKRMYRRMEELKYGNGKTTGCPTKTLGHDRQAGFTLVELVVVIVIVIVLSSVSVPIYRSYLNKAKLSEGYALLGTLLSAQKAYYSEYGNFFVYSSGNNFTCNDTILGIDARGNKYFSWFRAGGYVDSNELGVNSKTSFVARVIKPEDLYTPSGKKELYMTYNMDGGTTIEDDRW